MPTTLPSASTLTPQTLSNIGCMSAEGEKVRGDQLAEAEECWRMHAEPSADVQCAVHHAAVI